MGAVKRLRPAGGELVIACHDPNIRKIFEITLLDRVFQIFDTPGAGVEYLRGSARGRGSDVSSSGLNRFTNATACRCPRWRSSARPSARG